MQPVLRWKAPRGISGVEPESAPVSWLVGGWGVIEVVKGRVGSGSLLALFLFVGFLEFFGKDHLIPDIAGDAVVLSFASPAFRGRGFASSSECREEEPDVSFCDHLDLLIQEDGIVPLPDEG